MYIIYACACACAYVGMCRGREAVSCVACVWPVVRVSCPRDNDKEGETTRALGHERLYVHYIYTYYINITYYYQQYTKPPPQPQPTDHFFFNNSERNRSLWPLLKH
jgi:hypothetical protein